MSFIAASLEQALSLIDTPDKWEKGFYARTKRKMPTSYQSACAASFCAEGAIMRSCGIRCWEVLKFFEEQNKISCGDIVSWNDSLSRTHDQVLEAFNKSIAAAKEKGV